ncbi:hypothetical protein LTR08_005907 [Meristemomyces frigidus]|nr:hypothetical protein LTR08_005907 [Meristemomyces frigidus]
MADAPSPASSDLSEPPSIDSEPEDPLSTAAPSSRPSVDHDHLAPPPKRRKITALATSFDRAPSSQPAAADADADDGLDAVSLSSDAWSDAPAGSPIHDEWAVRDEAQTQCLWRDCPFGAARNNDELVAHVQATHCATGGPKRSKYVCEWGECQRKASNHPSGYALKAHMRSHTKEKPYYCQLPECDKAFTRSDALAKHMRTVHEPEQPRGTTAAAATANDPTPPGKRAAKPKASNGNTPSSAARPNPNPNPNDPDLGHTHDEDGNEITRSPANDNITYIPAHHPITGQPGFMIHYPSDIQFTAWESAIAADQLMRLLRRQLDWANKEQEALRRECEALELQRKEEWALKEILLEGVMEAEWAREEAGIAGSGEADGEEDGDAEARARVYRAMERDVQPAKQLAWTPGTPHWRKERPPAPSHAQQQYQHLHPHPPHPQQYSSAFAQHHSHPQPTNTRPAPQSTPPPHPPHHSTTPSPPHTGHSGGFDGEGQPYDNYLADRMAGMERLKAESARKLLQERDGRAPMDEGDAEADAAGALMGMSWGPGKGTG